MVEDEKDIGREAEELLAGREGWLISKVVDGASSLVQKGARLCVSRDPRWLPEVDRLGQSFQTVLAEGLANAPWIEDDPLPCLVHHKMGRDEPEALLLRAERQPA